MGGEKGVAFIELDISKTAPNLKILDCKKSSSLTKINLGRKEGLRMVDIRYTKLKQLDLSDTNIKETDFGGSRFIPHNDEDDTDEIAPPFKDGEDKVEITWGTLVLEELKYRGVVIKDMLSFTSAFELFMEDVKEFI